jgi:ribose transport system substrate-binding protein
VELNQGFDQAIKDSGKNVKVLARQTANYARVDAQNVMENLLQQFKEIDGVMAANDAMALGAIEAIAAAGRLDKIKVSGNNGNADALKAMKEGKLVCTPRQLPRDQGYWGVAVAWMAMKGLDLPSEIYIDSPLITPENVEEHLKYSY